MAIPAGGTLSPFRPVPRVQSRHGDSSPVLDRPESQRWAPGFLRHEGQGGEEGLMPATSKAQLRAMYAAAAGHSNLGIPQKVGAEFVKATPRAKRKSLISAHEKSANGCRP